MYLKTTIEQYISELSSGEPVPGGGSVSALVGSLGGALSNMVGNLTFPKKSFKELPEEDKDKLYRAQEDTKDLVEQLKLIIDEDSIAFRGVMEALKLPKDTEEEKNYRASKLEEGYKEALEVPLRCAKLSFEVLKLMDIFLQYGNVGAITDVGTGVLLSYSSVEGSLFNVLINLKYIKDIEYKERITNEIDELLNETKKIKEELLAGVYEAIAQ